MTVSPNPVEAASRARPRELPQPAWLTGTLAQATLLVILVLAGAEIAARTFDPPAFLPPPSFGMSVAVLERKILEMDALTAEGGRFDCVFIGDSTVFRAVHPPTFSEGYQAVTGEPIHCYNLGTGGLSPYEYSAVAEMAARRYRPALLVIGTHLGDYGPKAMDGVVESAWMRHATGEFSPAGWLVDSSSAYRLYTGLAMESQARQYDRAQERYFWDRADLGFNPSENHLDFASMVVPHHQESFFMSPRPAQGLRRFADLHASGIPLILYESPTPVQHIAQRPDYPGFVEQIGSFADESALPLIWTTWLDLIPADGWADVEHLNPNGALVFSRWLGERLGEMAVSGELGAPNLPGARPGD